VTPTLPTLLASKRGRDEARPRTEHIYGCIVRACEAGRPATVREIQADLSISSPSVVEYHIVRLIGEGRVVREPGMARSLRPAGWRSSREPKVMINVGRLIWATHLQCEGCKRKLPVGEFAQDEGTLEVARQCNGCASSE